FPSSIPRPPRRPLFPYTTLFRSLQVHVVQDLLLELALGDGAGAHQEAVGQSALAVVNVGDDREVPNLHAVISTSGKKGPADDFRSEEHTSELQSRSDLVCRLLLE